MSPRTVRVPPAIEGLFTAAEEVVSSYFRDRRVDPEHGSIEISGERYVLVRAAALSVDFFDFVAELYGEGRELEAAEFARNILFDLAHAIGRKDAKRFHAKIGLTDPIAKLSAGPVHFAYTGWAFVDLLPGSNPVPNDDYFLIYEHPYSFESDAWIRAGKTSVSPTCIMNSGYSSGWCQESFGLPLVAAEIMCRASGGEACRFVMAPPHRIEEHARTAAPGSRTSIPALFARKRLEDALRRAREDLEVRVEERTAALLREIEERQKIERILRQQSKLESLGRLAGGVAHDFNNLLAVVLANARVVARSLDEADSRAQQLAEISSACARAAELTRQLLAFGGAAPSGHESVELDRTVSELGRMLLRLVGDAIELEVHTAAAAISVPMQRSQLDQILVNLVVNARDAMPSGGALSVETREVTLDDDVALTLGLPRGRYASLAVHDTGTGMDEATQLSIFEPFFSTKLEGGGTGLGLSTVYGLVKQAGGAIAVESAPGAGSTFRIYLPIVEAEVASVPGEPSAAATGAGELLLVVEDQAAVRNAVSELAGLLGYRVLSADSPERALELCAKEGCDVLLTDIMLPQMNGVALAERITELCPKARVVFMSGNPGDALEPWQKAGRAFVFLAKPFGEEALAAALEPQPPA